MGRICFWSSWKPVRYQGVSIRMEEAAEDRGRMGGEAGTAVMAWSRQESKNSNQAAGMSTVQGRGREQGWSHVRELGRRQELQWAQKTSLDSWVPQTGTTGLWWHPLSDSGQHLGWFVVSWRPAVAWWPTAAPLLGCCLEGTVNSQAVP